MHGADVEDTSAPRHSSDVHVKINDSTARAEEAVRNEVAPGVAKSPGFKAGYWTREAIAECR